MRYLTCFSVFVLLLLGACQRSAPPVGRRIADAAAGGVVAGIPPSQIGLSKVAVTEVAEPRLFHFLTSEPGEAPLAARTDDGAPPPIPHTLVDFLPITLSQNLCVDCHQVETKEVGEPTPIPPSHFLDLRRATEVRRDEVAGARYNCIACHAAMSDVTPLVPGDIAH